MGLGAASCASACLRVGMSLGQRRLQQSQRHRLEDVCTLLGTARRDDTDLLGHRVHMRRFAKDVVCNDLRDTFAASISFAAPLPKKVGGLVGPQRGRAHLCFESVRANSCARTHAQPLAGPAVARTRWPRAPPSCVAGLPRPDDHTSRGLLRADEPHGAGAGHPGPARVERISVARRTAALSLSRERETPPMWSCRRRSVCVCV